MGAGWALLVMPGKYALARQASTRSERDSKVERRVATSRGKLRESTSATSTLPLHRSCASSGSSASSSGRTSERSSQPLLRKHRHSKSNSTTFKVEEANHSTLEKLLLKR